MNMLNNILILLRIIQTCVLKITVYALLFCYSKYMHIIYCNGNLIESFKS